MVHESLRIIREEHSALVAMLRSLSMMVERGPGNAPDPFFDVLRAMLFYIDEFPEKLHHPKESDLLFPKVLKAAPQVAVVLERLERAWELLGESRRAAFEAAARSYVKFYLDHMQLEEKEILPQAERALSEQDWVELDAAFASNRDPLNPNHPRDPVYDRLFTRIVMIAPEPIGLGSTR